MDKPLGYGSQTGKCRQCGSLKTVDCAGQHIPNQWDIDISALGYREWSHFIPDVEVVQGDGVRRLMGWRNP